MKGNLCKSSAVVSAANFANVNNNGNANNNNASNSNGVRPDSISITYCFYNIYASAEGKVIHRASARKK